VNHSDSIHTVPTDVDQLYSFIRSCTLWSTIQIITETL